MSHRILKILGIITILVLLTCVAQASDWPMFHHDFRHTGSTTEKVSDDLKLLWSYKTGGGVGSSPAVVDGKVFVGSYDNKIYCLDADDGSYILSYKTGDGVSSSPAVADGKIFVGSTDGRIYCLDEDGCVIWSYETRDSFGSSPVVVNGKVFVGGSGNIHGKIYCLNENTGKLIWRYTTGTWGYVSSSPAVANGKVFVGSMDNKIYCLNENTGELIWSYETGDSVYGDPAVVNGKVFVGSDKIYCLDENTGEFIWSYKAGDSVGSSLAVADGKVFVGSKNNKIYCLDENNGDLIWSYKTGDSVSSSPAVADGKVYVGSNDNKIYCLDENTGNLIWSYQTGGRVYSSPAVANGKVFVGSGDHKIYCFGVKSTPTPTVAPTAKPTAVPTAKPTAAPTAKPTAAPATPRPAPATAYPTPAPIAYPTPVPTLNLQISVTPNPVEAGKTVTVRVKSNGWGVEGANVYYVKSIYGIKTGRDVVVNGKYIGITSEGGWLSYTFDNSGVYAIGVTYNRLYNPSIEHLTVTTPTATPTPPPVARPTPRPTPTPISIPVATPTPPPVLPISPEYLYIIPIALFLILLYLIFYARGKKKKPSPSPDQKEEQISPPISESITIERAIYDPCKRDFVKRALPRMKEWVNRYDPGAYWFAISIQNNADKTIEEWGVELETSSALKVEKAIIEGMEYKIELRETHPEPYKNTYAIGVPKEYGVVIPKGGAQRVYFKLHTEKPKTTYKISGVFKSEITGDVPIRAKEFKYLCDAGVSPEAVKAELKKTFSEKDAARLANTFRVVQEIRSSYCNTDTTAREINKEFDLLKIYLTEREFLDEIGGIQRKINAELREDERLDEKHVEEVKNFCEKFTEMWIARFLR